MRDAKCDGERRPTLNYPNVPSAPSFTDSNAFGPRFLNSERFEPSEMDAWYFCHMPPPPCCFRLSHDLNPGDVRWPTPCCWGFTVDSLKPLKLWVPSFLLPPGLVNWGRIQLKKRSKNSSRLGDKKRRKVISREYWCSTDCLPESGPQDAQNLQWMQAAEILGHGSLLPR